MLRDHAVVMVHGMREREEDGGSLCGAYLLAMVFGIPYAWGPCRGDGTWGAWERKGQGLPVRCLPCGDGGR